MTPTPSPNKAFRWTSATGMVPLTTPPEVGSLAQAVNNLGDAAGGVSGVATVWMNDGNIATIGVFSGNYSLAYGINDQQQVVGRYQDLPSGDPHCFIWDPLNGPRDLLSLLPQDSGWTRIHSADDINDHMAKSLVAASTTVSSAPT